jgi:hypothetical protein
MYQEERRNIVGETWVEEEEVVKTKSTKNTERMTIHRTRTRALILECGHAVKVTRFTANIPTNNTRCSECERPAIDAHLARIASEHTLS